MVIFFIAAGTVLFILTYFFTYASVNGAATVSQNKPIEIELNNADRITMDLQRANVIFYKNKDNRILITYEPGLYESVPDYETMKPQVKYSKNELRIKMRSSDHIPTINIYIPSSLKHVTVLHEEGSLLFNDDCTYGLTVEGKKSEVKINYIRSLLNINVAEGNVTVLKGFLPKGSGIKVKIGNIRLCALLDDGDYTFSTDYGNIDFKSGTEGIVLAPLGYTLKNEFPTYTAGNVFVTLDSKVGSISALAEF